MANDWEYWSHFEARGTINDRLDYRVSPEFRFKDNFTDHYYSHLEFMLNWRVNSWCTLSPSYRHIQSLPGIDWITEQRPQLDLTLKWKMISMVGSDRNRMESRIRGKNTAYRYRNKLTFNLPKLRVMSTQPFFANEFFYDFEAREINKNRVYAGLDLTLLKSVKCSLQYILESSLKSDTWNNTNVLGTTLKYTF
ncbi:MAG: DUF2490 domain-containing protein [Candidatus Marinimicrobia bacterium]|nr:DUF2490 domain-containing protein [Candidatus Neomarinimicrobiota bacterium]